MEFTLSPDYKGRCAGASCANDGAIEVFQKFDTPIPASDGFPAVVGVRVFMCAACAAKEK